MISRLMQFAALVREMRQAQRIHQYLQLDPYHVVKVRELELKVDHLLDQILGDTLPQHEDDGLQDLPLFSNGGGGDQG